MVFGIVVYEARTGLFRLLRIGLLHTEQGCSIDLMFPEFTVVLQQVFPGIIPVMLVQNFGRTVLCTSGQGITSVIFTFEFRAVVVTEICTERQTFYRQHCFCKSRDENVAGHLIAGCFFVGEWVRV